MSALVAWGQDADRLTGGPLSFPISYFSFPVISPLSN